MIAWLTSRLAGPVLGALLVLALLAAGIQTARIDGWPFFGGGLKDQLQTAQLSLARVEGNVAAYKSASDACNASVVHLADTAKIWSQNALVAVHDAQGEGQKLNAMADRILALKRQRGACSAALGLLRAPSP